MRWAQTPGRTEASVAAIEASVAAIEASVAAIEDPFGYPARPPGEPAVLLAQFGGGRAEAACQGRELVAGGGEGVAGAASYQVEPVAGLLAEAIGLGQQLGRRLS